MADNIHGKSCNEAPDQHSVSLQHAATLVSEGRFEQAEVLYGLLRQRDGDTAQLLNNHAIVCGALGQTQRKLELLRRAVAAEPEHRPYRINLAYALLEAEQAEEALNAYRTLVAENPDDVGAHRGEAKALLLLGDDSGAEAALRRAAACDPAHAGVSKDLAGLLHRQGRVEEVLTAVHAALAAQPDNYELLVELGTYLQELGRDEKALEYFLYATSLEPGRSTAIVRSAISLLRLGDLGQASQLLAMAEELDPDDPDLLNLVALCFTRAGLLSKAVVCFEKAISLSPDPQAILGNLMTAQQGIGDLEEVIATGRRALALEPFQPRVVHNLMFAYAAQADRYNAEALQLAADYAHHLRANLPPLAPDAMERAPYLAATPRRLRVGFLSAEIGSHVVGRFLESFLRHYDRSTFEVELLSLERHFEARGQALAAQADAAHPLMGLDSATARAFLRERRYDILVETSGYTSGTGLPLLVERCAPIQCHYIGYHASTGFDTIDYFIGDAITASAELQPQFVEQLWRLPRPWLASPLDEQPPKAVSTAASPWPILGSFNQLAKVREQTLAHWGAALQAVPNAEMVIKDKLCSDPVIRARIAQSLASHGIAADRLRFLEPVSTHQDHLALYNQIDVALDATPWSSATTGFDALSMGVPLVAIRGRCMGARMSASLVTAIGRPEWVADHPDTTATIAADLCGDLEGLRRAKGDLQQQVLEGPLFDAADLARCLGEAFQQMAAARLGS